MSTDQEDVYRIPRHANTAEGVSEQQQILDVASGIIRIKSINHKKTSEIMLPEVGLLFYFFKLFHSPSNQLWNSEPFSPSYASYTSIRILLNLAAKSS